MSDSRAFTFNIDPNGSGISEDNSVHEVSPAWVLTFVRWATRDTFRTPNAPPLAVLAPLDTENDFLQVAAGDPLVTENDCLQVSIIQNKGALTHSMTALMIFSDINYETALAPGDFVFVNMLNWDKDARRVADAARAQQAINGSTDGFKGMFKIQGVRRVVTVDPQTGTRTLLFRITAFSHTEFNNTIYFNPYLVDPNQDTKNQLLFASLIGNDWKLLVNAKGLVSVQDILAALVQSFIGNGISDDGTSVKAGTVKTFNTHFFMPSLVGSLLGIDGVKAAKDVYNYIFGLQHYASGSTGTALEVGTNPTGLYNLFGRIFYTPKKCQGSTLLKPEYWNQVKAWSILNQYTNAPLNELYTCFRISPNGSVMPTVVFRQIPFTNEDYSFEGDVTKFLTIPRWKVNPALIIEEDLGRDESARVNFVQYFGRSTLGAEGADIALQIGQNNYLYDINDVQRSGLRPYIVTTQFDDPTSQNKDYLSPIWAKIVGDALIGGHLKLNGTITTVGLTDPITIGDNFELDGVVYHIEQITHTCSYNPMRGYRTFRTTISLSNGIDISSSENGTRYPEMSYVVGEELRKQDWKNNQLLPGVSDAQDVFDRKGTVDAPDITPTNVPFSQPTAKNGSSVDGGDDT